MQGAVRHARAAKDVLLMNLTLAGMAASGVALAVMRFMSDPFVDCVSTGFDCVRPFSSPTGSPRH
jgi:hypothetical protein